ncbi:MAG: TolC family protein [Bacteroidia bacterium]
MSSTSERRKTFKDFIGCFVLISKGRFITGAYIIILSLSCRAQNKKTNDTVPFLNLDQCIAYAFEHQPGLLQSDIGITIAQKTNAINLSGWLPQVYLGGSLTHYGELPTALQENSANPNGPPIPVKTGVDNTATPQLSATETIVSPNLIYAAKSAHLLVEQAKEADDSAQIGLIATVSAAFYNLLNTLEQVNVLKEDTAEFAKNYRDAYHQYIGGIVDKTDYEQAIITLNNSKAQLKQATENVAPQYASLKQVMGFPPGNEFNVNFDTAQMMREIAIDTTQQLQYEKRIEYQLLETEKSLQQENINYYRYSFIPTLSAFYNYINEYENNSFSNLFSPAYPYSYFGASISIPLFTGFSRLENLQKAKLQGQILDLSEVNLKSAIYTQYTSALANYKSNFYDLHILKENMKMAKDVYSVVSLQYRQGIVAYLNVITAEDNLVSSEINYTNALFQLLLNKVELEKAMGNISPKH